jgi:hypothetical protein
MTYTVQIGKKEYTFDITGVKKGRIIGEGGRRGALLILVQNNPNIQHTHLLAITDDLDLMPKFPAERILNQMEQDKTLQSTKHGTSPNSKRTWSHKKLAENPENIIKRLDKKFTHAEKQLKKLEKKLDKYEPSEMVSIVTSFMRMIWMLDWNVIAEKSYYTTLELSEFKKRHHTMKEKFIEILDDSEYAFGLFDAVESEANEFMFNAEINFEDALDYYY